jgi:hypothetical protein
MEDRLHPLARRVLLCKVGRSSWYSFSLCLLCMSQTASLAEDDNDWYKFDDNKVTPFPEEKLATLEGGGEDSSAYVLLYRSRPLA